MAQNPPPQLCQGNTSRGMALKTSQLLAMNSADLPGGQAKMTGCLFASICAPGMQRVEATLRPISPRAWWRRQRGTLVPLDGKVPPVAKEEFLGIVFHQVIFSPDFLG